MSLSKLVTISIDDLSYIIKKLNTSDKLSNIRVELENSDINNDMLLFSKKEKDGFYEIEREQERNFLLEEIITVENILYLRKRFHWKVLNDKCKLNYGRAMSFDGMKIANKIAFKMKNCNLKLIGTEGYKKGQIEFKSNEDWMKKTSLFFNIDNNAYPVGLGLVIKKLKNKNFSNEIVLTYQYTEYSKASLKLSKENLEPTSEFINLVNEAIKSKNPREEFMKIIEEYGQIIPTEFIFGGRVYFKNGNISSASEFYKFNHMKLLGGKHPDEEKFDEKYWIESLKDYQNWDCIEYNKPISIFQLLPDDLCKKIFKSIGKRILYTKTEDCDYYLNKPGKPKIYELDNLPQNISKIIQNEDADCDFFAAVVDTEDLKNIFFNCQILRLNGKTNIMIHCVQKKFRKYKYKLKIGLMVTGYDIDFESIFSDISVELVKENYDSQNPREFFSIPLEQKWDLGLMKASGNPFFGIPILSDLDSSNKSLIIGHNFRNTQIDIFSYSLEKKCYVNLPKFTFCTFIIILNNSTSNAYASLPIKPMKLTIFRRPFIRLEERFTSQSSNLNAFEIFRKVLFKEQRSSSNLNPKYVSIYLSNDNDDNHKPIFLKQKTKGIKLKHVDCNCNGTCSICNKKTKKSCILFDPDISY